MGKLLFILMTHICQVSELNCADVFDVLCCGTVLMSQAFNFGQFHVSYLFAVG